MAFGPMDETYGKTMVLALGAAMAVQPSPMPRKTTEWVRRTAGDGMGQAFGKGNGVRGTVTAAAADSFTIHTDEGDTYKVFYSPNTRLMKDRQPIEAADIHVGDMLMAGGMVDAKAKTVGAVLLSTSMPRKCAKPARVSARRG